MKPHEIAKCILDGLVKSQKNCHCDPELVSGEAISPFTSQEPFRESLALPFIPL